MAESGGIDTMDSTKQAESYLNKLSNTSVKTEDLMKQLHADPYDEDEAELRFLLSKPTCFIVLGKPGAGKSTLAKKLAVEWKCQLISMSNLLMEEIELQTETGNKVQEILLRGEAVPEDMCTKILEDKINSPEVAHHGYVLDGFPSMCEDYISVKDQLELIKNWKLKPDFIIHMKISDKDLEVRRVGQRVDPVTGELYTKDQYDPEKPPKPEKGEDNEEEEEDEDDEMLEEEEEMNEVIELPAEVRERLIKRPEDLPANVAQNINSYKSNVLRMLEDYMADHDQQYLIELDANKDIKIIFPELFSRLQCFVLRPAAVATRLVDPEDDEIMEDIDTDELMRTVAPKQMVAPKYRWRRSKWLRYCPVSLAEGNLLMGKPEFAVSFLDKMYFMATNEAMGKFMKNPRIYLLPPQPRPPCKLCVVGPPLSGKTTMANLLADKYGAQVLKLDELMKPRLDEEKTKTVDAARTEALENAISLVKQKIKDQIEAERAAKLEAEEKERKAKEAEAADAEENKGEDDDSAEESKDQSKTSESGDQKDDSKAEAKPENETAGEAKEEGAEAEPKDEEDKKDDTSTSVEATSEKPIEVDETHPEVKAMVEAAVKTAEEQDVTVAAEVWIDVLEEAIRNAEDEMRKTNPKGPLFGGWILDNFPHNKDQWNALLEKGSEKGVLPDDIIYMRDESDNGEFLLKRWYKIHKEMIDDQMQVRLEKEAEIKRQKDEEARVAAEEAARLEKLEAERQKELERQRRLEDGEEEEEDEVEAAVPSAVVPVVEEPPQLSAESVVEQKTDEALPEGPEIDAQREVRRNADQEWLSCLATISNLPIDPINVDLVTKDDEGVITVIEQDDMLKQCINSMEKRIQYTGWELQGMDIDEEEEDNEAADAEEAMAEEDAEEAEEEEDPNRSSKKQLGDTNYYCPVMLKEKAVLWPGNPEVAAKYREKIYYLSTPENRDKFLENPTEYLPVEKPLKAPPVRLLILGPRGAGKSLHGRHFAQKMGLFHIKFRDRLQELLMKKTKKKIGPEFEEPEEEYPEEMEDDETAEGEGEGAITNPDGSKMSVAEEAKEGEGEEEDEGPQFTEDEEAMVQYLKEDEPLPPEVLDKILPEWWNKEPFRSTGFILEGFPRNADECEYMAANGLFPDSAILLQVEDTDVIGRLLPPKLEKWKQRRDKKLAYRQKLKDKAKKKRDTAMAKRREELTKEAEEKKAERKAQKEADKAESEAEEDEDADDEDDEDEEEDDIEAQLAEEFEEEEEEEEEEDETEEDATDRIRNDLEDMFDKDTNGLANVQEKLEEMLIPRYEVEAGKKTHIVRYLISKKLKNIVTYRHSLFERVYAINERLAVKMLQTGYKQPSRFGRWCPVKLHEGDCIQPMQGPGYTTYPAIYRSHVYFLSSSKNREDFMLDPMTYLLQPTPKPVVPMRIAIIGPPKSGKTTVAKRFARDFGMIRLSIGEALRSFLELQPKSILARTIKSHLVKGLTVPDELAVQALEYALMDMRCQTRGYVLDGYPMTRKQIDLMTQRSIIPVRIIELEVTSKDAVTRATIDRYSPDRLLPLHDSAQIFAVKLAAWNKEIGAVREWYKEEHANLVKIPGEKSKWWVWDQTLRAAKESVVHIQTYLQRLADGNAACIGGMCITPKEFVERLGDFNQYCPVSLVDRGELVDCSVTQSLKYAVEFRGHYYKTAGENELEAFLKDPERYVPPLASRKLPPPELLPIRRTSADVKAMFPIQIELQGYCPVTYKDGKCRYEAIVPGDPELVVEYRGKIHYFNTEDELQKFMRLPEDYYNQTLPHKLPPKKIPISVTSLPMLGYMEQTVATAITKSLTAVGNCKPKYPFLTASKSALIYVAYHLKAFNPKSSEYVRKKYKKKLQKFEETCELIKYLGDNMSKRYKEPGDRPIDFDFKMERFIELKQWSPNATADSWVS